MLVEHRESTPIVSSQRSSPSIAATPSPPRRKRRPQGLDDGSHPAPHKDTMQEFDSGLDSGSGSPQTKVAERLRGLDIHRRQPRFESESPRKRFKPTPEVPRRGQCRDVSADPLKLAIRQISQAKQSHDCGGTGKRDPELRFGGGEWMSKTALGCGTAPSRSGATGSVEGSFSALSSHRSENDIDEHRCPSKMNAKRLASPPPPLPDIPLPSKAEETTFPNIKPDFVDHATSLTWQDSEITGHELDPAFPDDDGEGINGVGFRPTPAIAYARSRKRAQQVNNWKVREAKEARQKRMNRRRGVVVRERTVSGEGRSVRFVADAG